jgi:murein DD-endopeptidase MepM/ murein hydrolase activator NlpD
MAIQSLQDVNNKLLASISDLLATQRQLTATVDAATNAKEKKEQEYQNLNNRKIIADQLSQEKQQFLAQTKNQEKVYQSSLAALQQRQLEIASEIDALEAPLREKINFKSLPSFVPGLLAMPLNVFTLTQGYGSTAFAKTAYKTSHWHNGVDLAAPIGTPIYAVADGIVLAAANQDAYCPHGAYGKYVAIKHLNGLTTVYGHMSLIVAKKNQSVKRGDVIGYVGKTGFATGPHLHFGVYDSETFTISPSKYCGPEMPYGGDINPLNYLPTIPSSQIAPGSGGL